MYNPCIHAERTNERRVGGNDTTHIKTTTIAVIILAAAFPLNGVLMRGPANLQQMISTSNPLATSPYVTTFPISQNSSDFTPFVLYPASDKTVWVATIKQGNIVNNVPQPSHAQIVNFTIGPGGEPIVTVTITLRNAIPSDIVYDHTLERVWFLENDSLAYYNPAAPGNITIEQTFRGGSPQYMAIDSYEKIWITLLGTNRIVEYDPLGRSIINFYSAPASNTSLQGITTAPDGTIWFTETTAGKLGHIIPCPTAVCNITDYGPPPTVHITFPIQLAAYRDGTVWFTDHGGSQFGSYNPSTGEWRVFGLGYCSETYNPDCPIGLPNAIALDSNGMIWFSEHFAGRVAKYDPSTESLTEYSVPANTIPYVWWMWPGPGNLVWFTAFGLGRIGYVNASLPVPISISTGVESVKLEQGTSQPIPASVSNLARGPLYLNVSANGHDAPFGSPPLLHGFADQSQIPPTSNSIPTRFRITAAWTADLGARFVTLTAYNGNVAVSAFLIVNVTPTTIPFIFRTSAPYVSVAFAFSIGLGSVGLFLIRLPRSYRKDRKKGRGRDRNYTSSISIKTSSGARILISRFKNRSFGSTSMSRL